MPTVSQKAALEAADKMRPASPYPCPICLKDCVDCHEPLPSEEIGKRCFRNTSTCPPTIECMAPHRTNMAYDMMAMRAPWINPPAAQRRTRENRRTIEVAGQAAAEFARLLNVTYNTALLEEAERLRNERLPEVAFAQTIGAAAVRHDETRTARQIGRWEF